MRASAWLRKLRRSSSSHSGVAKKLSHSALSYASPTRAGRRTHASFLAPRPERDRGVLRALVAVMNHPVHTAPPEGHVQRVQDQFGAQVGGHRPADHPAAEGVQHHRHVQKPRPRPDIGDVSHPQLIGFGGVEVPIDQIRRHAGSALLARGGLRRTPAAGAGDAGLAHQPPDPLRPDPLAFLAQLGVDARAPVHFVVAAPDLLDPLGQLRIAARSRRGLAAQPCVPRRPAVDCVVRPSTTHA